MLIKTLEIPGLILLTPEKYHDERGWFSEPYSRKSFQDAGIDVDFVQDNHSYSACKNTIRGLHFQLPPFGQAKLIRVLKGAALDVVVDLRQDSPTYRAHSKVVLSAENGNQLFIPIGFAHGFKALTDDVEVSYKKSNYYRPENARDLYWNDPDLAIDWGICKSDVIISDKDSSAGRFKGFKSPY